MQPSPVAPSATVPAVVPTPTQPSRPTPTFAVSLTTNGGIAYLHEPWSATLSVTSTDPSAGLPASVGLRCGDDPEQVFSGFIGLRVVSCTFQQAGTYPVTAAVVAPSGLLTTNVVTLTAMARPTPPLPPPTPPAPAPPPPQLLLSTTCTAKAPPAKTPCNVTANLSNGELVTYQLTDVRWDWGDGDTSHSLAPNAALGSHPYKQSGTYTVVVTTEYMGLAGRDVKTVTIP